ncbi:MAG: iron-containing alcohol dehydrogenase [Verrucomicrobia bacterium]|nr:iron-containing alcohol dehydrogenase [Verrucomicrobiota bacterium]
MVDPFASRPSPKLIFGNGALSKLSDAVREIGVTSVLLVTDKGIVKAGHVINAQSILESAGIRVHIYDEVSENPTESDAARCCAAATELQFEGIVALGGGSSMDTAKACNFLLTNGGKMSDYHGYGKANKPFLPFVAIPTTAGTGSECQSYALVSRESSHEKMACGDPKALARVAILDPDITDSQPLPVAVQTGIDALAHALEASVSTRRTELSAMYSEAAFRHIARAIDDIVDCSVRGDDRGHMLLGASLSGLAIENSMLGAAHASANPLTARYNVIHGRAVAIMLPHVMHFNEADPEAAKIYVRYSNILRETGISRKPLIDWVADLVGRLELPEITADASDIDKLAAAAALQWTGQFNPRPLEVKDFVDLYRAAFALPKPA